jgi:hypothetical protein
MSEEEIMQKFRKKLGAIDRRNKEYRDYREVIAQQDYIVNGTMTHALDKVEHSGRRSLGWLQSSMSSHLTGHHNEMFMMYVKQRLQEVYVITTGNNAAIIYDMIFLLLWLCL